MEFLSNLKREEFLAEVVTGSFQQKKEVKNKDMEIYVDPKFQYTEEQLRAHELSKNDVAWKKYFGI